jgi:hypothetical protein
VRIAKRPDGEGEARPAGVVAAFAKPTCLDWEDAGEIGESWEGPAAVDGGNCLSVGEGVALSSW